MWPGYICVSERPTLWRVAADACPIHAQGCVDAEAFAFYQIETGTDVPRTHYRLAEGRPPIVSAGYLRVAADACPIHAQGCVDAEGLAFYQSEASTDLPRSYYRLAEERSPIVTR
jgi:hypothetical protein